EMVARVHDDDGSSRWLQYGGYHRPCSKKSDYSKSIQEAAMQVGPHGKEWGEPERGYPRRSGDQAEQDYRCKGCDEMGPCEPVHHPHRHRAEECKYGEEGIDTPSQEKSE